MFKIDHMDSNRIYRWSSLQGFPLIQIKYALLSISNFNLNGHNVAVRFVTLILQIRNPPIFTNRQLSVGQNIMISTCTVIVITPFGIETGLVKLYQNRVNDRYGKILLKCPFIHFRFLRMIPIFFWLKAVKQYLSPKYLGAVFCALKWLLAG